MVLGIALGILIGLITGVVMMLLIRAAEATKSTDVKALLTVTGELLAIPTFWFGGPWVTTGLLESVDRAEILPPYMVSLAGTFVVVALYALVRLIISVGNDIGRAEGTVDG